MSDIYCYSNNGLSMRCVPHDYVAATGEKLFDNIPDSSMLAFVFANYATQVQIETNKKDAFEAFAKDPNTMDRIQEAVTLGQTTWDASDVVAWMEYRRALRQMIQTGTGNFPTKPSYPHGT